MTKINILVDKKVWNEVRNMTGGKKISDNKRSVIIHSVLSNVDLKSKLRPEMSDTKNDKIIKSILRDLM